MTKLRYFLIRQIIKYITPSFYLRTTILDNLGCNLRIIGKQDIINKFPRPSIKLLKDLKQGKSLIGAEIGVWKGDNAKSILQELNIQKLFLIDSWNNYKDYISKFNLKNCYQKVLKIFNNDNRIKILKMYSHNAVKYFNDNTLDFIYIDGNHSYKYVYNDIKIWHKKVKSGGMICGHDILNIIDVLKAVRNYCYKNQIKYYINPPDWFFIKE